MTVQSNGKNDTIMDLSLWGVVITNLVSIVMAVVQNWDMGQILWVYWGQSVIIGAVNVYRILSLKEFTTEGMTRNGKSIPETEEEKKSVASFFALHYGFFHFIYFFFLLMLHPLTNYSTEEFIFLVLIILGFFSAHGFSYRYNLDKDFKHKKPDLGTIMFYPYLRIIPMHLTIIIGSVMTSSGALVFFMALKTLADGGMHMIEHHLFRKKAK